MSADKQTPQPAPAPYATVDVGCGAGFHTYITDRTGRKIGVVWGPITEKVWTAALFAASPELLIALKNLCGADRDELNDGASAVWNEAIDAIRKAEGVAESASAKR